MHQDRFCRTVRNAGLSRTSSRFIETNRTFISQGLDGQTATVLPTSRFENHIFYLAPSESAAPSGF